MTARIIRQLISYHKFRIIIGLAFTVCLINIVIVPVSGQIIQKDTLKEYKLLTLYPALELCLNCKQKLGLPEFLCGHDYRTIFVGASNSDYNLLQLGFAFDRSDCDPHYGTDYYAATILTGLSKSSLSNGIQLSYLRNNLFGVQFYFLKFGLGAALLTDYKQVDFYLQPELRICDNMDFINLLRRINLTYSYRYLPFEGDHYLKNNIHQFGLIINLSIRGGVQ